jgi:aminobenzoyl-glutamate utilization protein B
MRCTTLLCLLTFLFSQPVLAQSTTPAKQTAMQNVDAKANDVWAVSRTIWENPEVGLEETKAAAALSGLLEENGFSLERGVAQMPTAFVATWGTGKPVIGILGEFDALPGLSQQAGGTTQVPVIKGAPGQGCGHSIFGAAGAAGAIALKAAMEKHNISGTIKFFGCPAEETVIGKVYMARDGVFDGLDACLSWHPGGSNATKSNGSLALNNFAVTYHGKTAHAAAGPWGGRSALDAVELLNFAVNQMREHVKPTVRIHYSIPNGGVAPNIVPDYARVWYYIRDKDREGVDHVYQRVLKAAEAAAMATETTWDMEFLTGVHPMNINTVILETIHNNMVLVGPPQFTEAEQAIARGIQETLGKDVEGMADTVQAYKKPTYDVSSSGSTDVAEVSWMTPLAEFTMASSPKNTPGHHWAVVSTVGSTIGRKAMLQAAKVFATSGLDLMTNNKLLENAWAEFDGATEGKTYQSPLPSNQPPPKELPK